jgi:hypothetical protein
MEEFACEKKGRQSDVNVHRCTQERLVKGINVKIIHVEIMGRACL